MQVKPDKEQAFLEASKPFNQASRAEEGNESYDLMKSTEQDHQYTVVEIWKDGQALQTHNGTEHMAAIAQQAPNF
ncbi:putative quinol monooxygenase [Planococcus halocryophilus]|uniref:putative quinol monooxygenase n=1 Tax=Planococcus halocryophilus TaxID=1215089 RepID=UPI001F0E1700|nr:putative quinol monooxygenase [Planococcus halocryophilus]MCH4827396.1 antibiotic biosynthesis monooxygenase [Planococcus halocryophilus]